MQRACCSTQLGAVVIVHLTRYLHVLKYTHSHRQNAYKHTHKKHTFTHIRRRANCSLTSWDLLTTLVSLVWGWLEIYRYGKNKRRFAHGLFLGLAQTVHHTKKQRISIRGITGTVFGNSQRGLTEPKKRVFLKCGLSMGPKVC
jgi:hypothetical protein